MSATRRRLLELSVPNVLAGLTVPLAGLVDTAVLGHLPDPRYLAGVALGSVVFDLLWGVFGFLRMGTTGLVARSRGQDDAPSGQRTLLRSMGIALGLGLVILWLREPLGEVSFAVLSGTTEVQQEGLAYYSQRILAAPAALLGFALIGGLLGEGRSKAVLLVAVLTNLCNIGLDILFVWEWGWGAGGAGLATAISQTLGCVVALGFVLPRLWQTPDLLRGLWENESLKELLVLQSDILVRTLTLMVTFACFTNISATMGTAILAANAILIKVVSLGSYFIDGIGFATETMVGEAYGREDTTEETEILSTGTRWGVMIGLVFSGAFVVAPFALLGFLTSQTEVLTSAASMTPWLLPVMGFGAAAYILDGYFLGRSDGATLRVTMVLSTSLGFLPLACIAYTLSSPHGLWGAMMLFMAFRVGTMWRRLPKLQSASPP